MRPQKIVNQRNDVKKEITVYNEKVDRLISEDHSRIRVVVYLETAGMSNERIYHFIKTLNQSYSMLKIHTILSLLKTES